MDVFHSVVVPGFDVFHQGGALCCWGWWQRITSPGATVFAQSSGDPIREGRLLSAQPGSLSQREDNSVTVLPLAITGEAIQTQD
jgi:hypothetical protein